MPYSFVHFHFASFGAKRNILQNRSTGTVNVFLHLLQRADDNYDLILHERHMTGEKSSRASAASTVLSQDNPAAEADSDDGVRLRDTSGAYSGFKPKRRAKIIALLTKDPKTGNPPNKFYSICKKIFRELEGRPAKKTAKKDIQERPVSRDVFCAKFKLDLVLDEIKVK